MVSDKLNLDKRLEDRRKLLRKVKDISSHGVDRKWGKTINKEALDLLPNFFGEEGEILKNKINECKRGNYCKSIYCYDCSRRIANVMKNRWIELSKNKTLYSITIIDKLCNRTYEDLKVWMKEFRDKIQLCKKRDKRFYLDGWIEIEVIDKKLLYDFKPKSAKERTKIGYLKQRIKEGDSNDDFIYFPHLHGIVTIGDMSIDEYTNIFKHYFPNKDQFYMSKVGYNNQKVEEGIDIWSKYIMKITNRSNQSLRIDLYTFKTTFEGYNPIREEELVKSYRIPSNVIAGLMYDSDRIKGKTNKGLIVSTKTGVQ